MEKSNDANGFPNDAFDPSLLPDYDREFIDRVDVEDFAKALNAPESAPLGAVNGWRPIHQRVRKGRTRGRRKRTKDESREGFVYNVLKWPILFVVLGWILVLCVAYLFTRIYVLAYERMVTWRGQRQTLRKNLQSKSNFSEWKTAAEELDDYLGNSRWRSIDEYAYYDHATVKRVKDQLKSTRLEAQDPGGKSAMDATQRLRSLIEACVKRNAFGIEAPNLYSESYVSLTSSGSRAQSFIDELHDSLRFLLRYSQLDQADKYALAQHLHRNFGRTALALSGGATFSYFHFGVIRALVDHSLLPGVITGTSGGALVAAMVCTRKDEELKQLLVPALAHRIKACEDGFSIWGPRWWRTGARFDSIEWATHCSWFCRGSTTFREAYERTGRILNVSCVPSDPHSPTILTNYLTAPECVIWSAVLASAAVPGILNPVVLMMKTQSGNLTPYSFGHKWKDGSLRTDIPLKALNLQFNVSFSIVSQVNPHVNLFFFSSRGTVGRPVTHRKGRGWRGGYLGSAVETSIKLDLTKCLKILKHLELLPRPLGQDWSGIWLQQFSGTVTLWPKIHLSDFYYLLSDPSPQRLAYMIRAGQRSAFPKLLFIENRMKIERLIEGGLLLARDHDLRHGPQRTDDTPNGHGLISRLSNDSAADSSSTDEQRPPRLSDRHSRMLEALRRQSGVFFDHLEGDGDETNDTDNGVNDGLSDVYSEKP
ncbi:MAG: hypothetical protein Q9211_000631 [Gyalolechia sp. 1 TL-2023]